jgi:hypothetical protein
MLVAHDMGQKRGLLNTELDVRFLHDVEKSLAYIRAISFRSTCSNLVCGID